MKVIYNFLVVTFLFSSFISFAMEPDNSRKRKREEEKEQLFQKSPKNALATLIKIICNDGVEIWLPQELAQYSGTIKDLANNPMFGTQEELSFSEIDSQTFNKIKDLIIKLNVTIIITLPLIERAQAELKKVNYNECIDLDLSESILQLDGQHFIARNLEKLFKNELLDDLTIWHEGQDTDTYALQFLSDLIRASNLLDIPWLTNAAVSYWLSHYLLQEKIERKTLDVAQLKEKITLQFPELNIVDDLLDKHLRLEKYGKQETTLADWVTLHIHEERLTDEKTLAIDTGDRITSLEDFKQIPDFEKVFSSVTTVDLNSNPITFIPPDFLPNFPLLKILDLQYCNIEYLLPEQFSQLEKLKEVRLNKNKLTTLPEHLFNSSIKEIDLSDNQLETIPLTAFNNLKNLHYLCLANNQISSLPATIFSSLTNLVTLDLWNNKLTHLDASLFNSLSKLENLDLRKNNLETLPQHLFNNTRSLRKLELQNNRLERLPENLFTNLHSLEDLDLSNNNISMLPSFCNLQSLVILDLSYNNIHQLDEDLFKNLASIEQIYLQDNVIERLPFNLIASLPALKQINFKKNPCVDDYWFQWQIDFWGDTSAYGKEITKIKNHFKEKNIKAYLS